MSHPPPEWDLILSAAQKNNVEQIQKLLSIGVPPNHANGVGQSALHIACLWANAESVKVLLEAGANVNAQNRITRGTPLHMLAPCLKGTPHRRLQTLKIVMDLANPDLSIVDAGGHVPLDLLPPDPQDEYDCQLHELLQPRPPELFEAATGGDVERVRSLLAERERDEIESLQFRGETLVSQVVSSLLESLDDSGDKEKPTQFVNVLQLLLDMGATTKSPSAETDPPLHRLLIGLQTQYARNEATLGVETLETAVLMFDSSSIPPDAWQLLQNAARRDAVDMLRFLIGRLNVDPNLKGRQGMTALHHAARSGKVEAVSYLLSLEKIDVQATNDLGKTALDGATVNDKDAVVAILNNFINNKKE